MSLPVTMPPMPKPSITMVNGSEAPARVMEKSAWKAGNATTTTYMPALPMVVSVRHANSLAQA
jgi:hypothetical protein